MNVVADTSMVVVSDASIEVIERVTGRRPRGWRAPLYNFSHRSADLLVSRGFRYDASLMGDDQPYLLETDGGRLVELPSHWGLDDWPQYVQSRRIERPSAARPRLPIFQSPWRNDIGVTAIASTSGVRS